MTNMKNFSQKYPNLTAPMNVESIMLKFGITNNEARKYNYHDKSPFTYADAASIIGHRNQMEDTYCLAKISDGIDFYGVFDGHGGWKIASFLKSEFVKYFSDITNIDYKNKDEVRREIINICWDVGKDIFDFPDCLDVGSTAIFALKFGKHIYLGNIGDSTAVIFDNKGNINLKTQGHKPSDKNEANRVRKRGSEIYYDRVAGSLAVSRSFGDNSYNLDADLNTYKGFKTVVSHKPSIYVFEIPEVSDNIKYYMVLGSDGLWDYCDFNNSSKSKFTFQQVIDTVSSMTPEEASTELVSLAFNTGIYDNITAVVVNL